MSKNNTGTVPASAEKAAPEPKAAEQSDSKAAGFYCYIGPSITGLIQHGAIYRGTRDAAVSAAAAAIRKYPLIKTLIVSGDKLPEARLKAKTPGNALYQNCQRIAGKV